MPSIRVAVAQSPISIDPGVNDFYSPGFEPVVFEVDGLTFGVVACIEVNFPELFAAYERAGVDGVLLSAYRIDSIFATKARSHAAINNYWIGLSAPAGTRDLLPSALIGPDGSSVVEVTPDLGGRRRDSATSTVAAASMIPGVGTGSLADRTHTTRIGTAPGGRATPARCSVKPGALSRARLR